MKKLVTIMVLIFSLFTSTQAVYSYYNSEKDLVLDEQNQLHVIEQTLTSDKQLVPSSVILKENETDVLEYKYEVLVVNGYDIEAEINKLMLTSSQFELENDGQILEFDLEFDQLETVEVQTNLFDEAIVANRVEITLYITLNGDMSYEDYNLICGEEIQFSLLLTLSKS